MNQLQNGFHEAAARHNLRTEHGENWHGVTGTQVDELAGVVDNMKEGAQELATAINANDREGAEVELDSILDSYERAWALGEEAGSAFGPTGQLSHRAFLIYGEARKAFSTAFGTLPPRHRDDEDGDAETDALNALLSLAGQINFSAHCQGYSCAHVGTRRVALIKHGDKCRIAPCTEAGTVDWGRGVQLTCNHHNHDALANAIAGMIIGAQSD